MSLRTKLLIFFIILALIPVVIVGTRMIQITRDELKSSANDTLSAVASQVAQEIENSLQLIPLQLVQESVESKNLGAREIVSLLTVVLRSISDISAIQLSVEGAKNPMIVIQDIFSKRLSNASLDPEQTLKLSHGQIAALLGQEEMFTGDLTYLSEMETWLLTVIIRVNEQAFERPATLSARINLSTLRRKIERIQVINGMTVTLLDRKGRQIFDPDRTDISQRELVQTAINRLDSTRINGVLPYTRSSGEQMLGAYDFPASLDWGVNVEKNSTDAYMGVEKMVRDWYYSILLGISFAILGAIVVSVSLTRPLRRLTQGARIIAGGDLSIQIEGQERKDEIGELSKAFNKMVEDLGRYIEQLTETTKAKERAEKELELARDIQKSLLPKSFPKLPQIEVWGKCDPAREVGGDYFDFFQISEHLYGMVIGDVSGKGVPAALFMAVSRTLFRILSSQENSPDQVLTEFNDWLVALDQGSNMFITLFYAVFDTETGRMIYSTAGHNMPYVRSAKETDGKFQMLPNMSPTMVAGMMGGMSMALAETWLNSGDVIVLYTDGMTEAINQDDEEFGEDRLEELLNRYADLSAQDMCEKLITDVQVFQTGKPQFDDMTLFILKVR
ncbi:MAG: hypothetical protein B6245_06230 [Desulfobacteraceae bacterium 4572_88]|nr:MAG: hypothetical protein B6245_06230 [Desulfobacteraceae bacterium 4572_88]